MKNLAVAAFALVFAACADTPSAPELSGVFANATAGCTATISSLQAQARTLFGSNAPNFNSVRGKLQNMDQFLRKGNVSNAQRRAHEIVEFVLDLNAAGRLSGTEAQITAFVNAVYCYAGIDIVIGTPEDTWFILPSDQPQILYGLDSSAAVSLPGFPVAEPSLLRIERFEGQLNTKLDQYPGYIRITLLNDGNTLLTGRATITVCATGLPADLNPANLRLGHGIRDTGFVITPRPTAADPTPGNVACGPVAPASFASRLIGAVRSLISPKELQATMQGADNAFGGGVSGTVTEFSPFAPVDAELSFGGGVSGTVTEFLRDGAPGLMEMPAAMSAPCAESVIGVPLAPACQPVVNISTKKGTILQQVPVDWFVRSDAAGRVAPRLGNTAVITCGSFGITAATFTSVNGNAGVCWTLGGFGLNRVVAKARRGGDAPAGVWFVGETGDSAVFDVTVIAPGPPTQLLIVSGNAQSGPAAAALGSPLVVRVLDSSNLPVANVQVKWLVLQGGGTLATATSVTDANGYASITYSPGVGSNEVKAFITDVIFKYVYFSSTGTTP